MRQVIDFSVEKTADVVGGYDMPYLTSSIIEAVNTCPKWGLVHNIYRKRFVTGYRQMALEAGSAMHDVFAAYNLWHLARTQGLLDHAVFHGTELFGQDRFKFLDLTTFVNVAEGKEANALNRLAYNVIGSSNFYDDPNDKNRTVANLEHAAIELAEYFLMNHTAYPLYVADKQDPSAPVGIEQSLDVVITVKLSDGTEQPIRMIGLADALYQNELTKLVTLGEYKTTSTMNDAWHDAFRMRHQITLYNLALEAYFPGHVSGNTILTGTAIPPRKTTMNVQHFSVSRDREHMLTLLDTALFTMDVIDTYKDTPLIAPHFTQSCSRYFRPCSLIDLCSSAKEDQEVMFEQMQIEPELSPSEAKALMRQQD